MIASIDTKLIVNQPGTLPETAAKVNATMQKKNIQ